jgi:hypothetical protein
VKPKSSRSHIQPPPYSVNSRTTERSEGDRCVSKGREEKLTYAAGQIKVNTNKVFASTLSPNVNVLVQFWEVSSEMYNVGAKRSRPIIVVGTRDVMPPSLFVS